MSDAKMMFSSSLVCGSLRMGERLMSFGGCSNCLNLYLKTERGSGFRNGG